MLDKGIVSKTFEVTKLLKSTIGAKCSDGRIKYTQFKLMFTKAFLRSALMNIYYFVRKLTDRDYTEDEINGNNAQD